MSDRERLEYISLKGSNKICLTRLPVNYCMYNAKRNPPLSRVTHSTLVLWLNPLAGRWMDWLTIALSTEDEHKGDICIQNVLIHERSGQGRSCHTVLLVIYAPGISSLIYSLQGTCWISKCQEPNGTEPFSSSRPTASQTRFSASYLRPPLD